MDPIARSGIATRPPRVVALGDSLTAGSQDGTTVRDRQEHGWAQVLARAADVEWNPAYVSPPGITFEVFTQGKVDLGHIAERTDHLSRGLGPLGLYNYYVGVPPLFLPVWEWLGVGSRAVRFDESHPQTSFAVPGFEARHLLTISSAKDMADEIHEGTLPIKGIAEEVPNTRAVLGTYHLFGPGSSVDRAAAADPDLVLLWAGGNDALHALFAGSVDDRSLTPVEDRKWTFNDRDPITGREVTRTTSKVVPGFESTWLGSGGIVPRLLAETSAEIMLMTVPESGVIASLRTLGQKIGPLPFRVVLSDGTDVTARLERWTIPDGVLGEGKNGRASFPPGTKVPLFTALGAFLRSGAVADSAALDSVLASRALLTEGDVVDPDELSQVTARVGQYNDVLSRAAALSPRVHLVDVNASLRDIRDNGRQLRGSGPDVRVTTTFTGVQDRGMEGIFSFDGVHPSDTGHAVIANEILGHIRTDLGADPRFAAFAQAAPVDEKAVFRQDPHRGARPWTLVLDAAHVEAVRSALT